MQRKYGIGIKSQSRRSGWRTFAVVIIRDKVACTRLVIVHMIIFLEAALGENMKEK